MKGKYLYYKSCWNKIPLSPGEEEEIMSSSYANAYQKNKPKRQSNFDKAANTAISGKEESTHDIFNTKYSTSINKAFHQILEYIVDYFKLDVDNPDIEKFQKVNIHEAKQEVCDMLKLKLDSEWAQIYCNKVKKLKDFKTLYRFLIYYSQF